MLYQQKHLYIIHPGFHKHISSALLSGPFSDLENSFTSEAVNVIDTVALRKIKVVSGKNKAAQRNTTLAQA